MKNYEKFFKNPQKYKKLSTGPTFRQLAQVNRLVLSPKGRELFQSGGEGVTSAGFDRHEPAQLHREYSLQTHSQPQSYHFPSTRGLSTWKYRRDSGSDTGFRIRYGIQDYNL